MDNTTAAQPTALEAAKAAFLEYLDASKLSHWNPETPGAELFNLIETTLRAEALCTRLTSSLTSFELTEFSDFMHATKAERLAAHDAPASTDGGNADADRICFPCTHDAYNAEHRPLRFIVTHPESWDLPDADIWESADTAPR